MALGVWRGDSQTRCTGLILAFAGTLIADEAVTLHGELGGMADGASQGPPVWAG